MRRRRRTRALVASLALTASLVVPAFATAQDFDEVKAERARVQQEIDETLAAIEELEARIHLTRDELASLDSRIRRLEDQAVVADEALQARARATFMRGELSTWESLLTSNGPQTALERAGLLAALSRRDVATLESSAALRTQIEQTRQLLTVKSAELVELEAEMDARSAALQERFEQVDEVYRELKTRRDRQVRLANGAQSGTYACIFNGSYHYRNTWGAPRSGGRRHKGTDVFSYYGAPVYAFTNGYIQRYSSSGLGGIGLYLWGDDGVQYYYAHLKGYAAGAYPGKRVEAGELIGYNGDSGNADRSAPHVHFEVHPGGGGAVNPYHWLAPVCP